MNEKRAKIILFNASPHTGNLGVSALCRTVVESIGQRLPSVDIAIASSRPMGSLAWDVPDSVRVSCVPFFARTRGLWKDGSQFRTRLSEFVPGIGGRFRRTLDNATAIVDISGGDSFTDLYRDQVWKTIQVPKFLAKRLSKPLILLPQTIGPFQDSKKEAIAAELIRYAELSCSRDAEGFRVLEKLSGFEGVEKNEKLHSGVDMAFLLKPMPPDQKTADQFRRIREDAETLVGLNVSGLIWFSELRAQQRGDSHGVDLQYKKVMRQFVEEMVGGKGCHLVLTPHVLAPRGSFESDLAASEDLREMVSSDLQSRVHVLPGTYDESEIKWAISQFDWFAGARMHPTIAGLSSGVPTLNLAYSIKAKGVFETVSQGHSLADLRTLSDGDLLETMCSHFNSRSLYADELKVSIPDATRCAEAQADRIASVIESMH